MKDRLLAQLDQRPGTHESSDLFDSYRLLNGNLITDDASAVSDGWMSSDGCTTDSSVTDNEVSNAPSMAQRSSSLSLAGLSELCGDRVGDDYAGSFLVGQDCDDVDDSGIGLDLYDVGHVRVCLQAYGNSDMCCFRASRFTVVRDVLLAWMSRLYLVAGDSDQSSL